MMPKKRHFKLFIILSCFLLLFTSLTIKTSLKAEAETQGNQEVVSIPVSVGSDYALLHLPDDYDSTSTHYPLIIFLHGAGETGTATSDLSKIYNSSNAGGPAYYIAQGTFPSSFTDPSTGTSYKFIVVSPQHDSWSQGAVDLNDTVQYMVNNYRVDTSRIYLTGLSAGGQGIWDYTSHYGVEPSYVPAAIVPMSMATTPTTDDAQNIAYDDVHLWGLGDDSGADLWGQRTAEGVDLVNDVLPGLAQFTAYPDGTGHSGWNTYGYNPTKKYTWTINGSSTAVSMNIYEWMLQFDRDNATPLPPVPSIVGGNQTLAANSTSTTLTATATLSGDSQITSYTWSLVSGSATIVSSNSQVTQLTGLQNGNTYTLKLEETDNYSRTVSVNVSVFVPYPASTLDDKFRFGSVGTTDVTGYTGVYGEPDSAVMNATSSDGINVSTISTTAWTNGGAPFAGGYTSGTTTGNNSGIRPDNILKNGIYYHNYSDWTDEENEDPANANIRISGLTPSSIYTLKAGGSYGTTDTATYTSYYRVGTNVQSLNYKNNTLNEVTLSNVQSDANGNINLRIYSTVAGSTYSRIGWLEVIGGSGATSTPNQAPTANAGADQNLSIVAGTTTTSTTLSGSGSDTDGSIASYAWSKVSGDGIITSPSSQSTTVTGITEGTSIFKLTVTDNDGATSTDQVIVNAVQLTEPTNNPPTASAGTDQTLSLPTSSTTLNGTGSTDSDGNIITYAWTKVSGPNTPTITNASASSTTVTGLVEGNYVFKLTVTDDDAATSSDTVAISVENSLVLHYTFDTATLNFSSSTVNDSSTFNNNGILSGISGSDLITGPINQALHFGYSHSVSVGTSSSLSNLANTPATFSAWVKIPSTYGGVILARSDNNEKEGWLFFVKKDHTIGFTSIVTSGNNRYLSSSTIPNDTWTLVTITSAGDPTSSSNFQLYINGNPVSGTDTVSDSTGDNDLSDTFYVGYNAYADTAGSQYLTGGDLDDVRIYKSILSADEISDLYNLGTIPANIPPTASAGNDQTLASSATSTTLNGTSSTDSDGIISSYAWTKVSGPNTPTFTNASASTTLVTGLTAGTYTFQLLVTDDNGATSSDQVNVTVNSSATTSLPDPILRYTFDTSDIDLASNTIKDIETNNNHTLVGTMTATNSVTGVVNESLNFTGSQYVIVNNPSISTTPNSNYTYTAWIKLPTAGEDGAIFGKALDDQSIRESELFIWGGELYSIVGSVFNGMTTQLPINQWLHVGLVNNASTHQNTLYLNGVAVSTNSDGTATNTNIDLLLGARRAADNTDYNFAFNGDMDDARIYNQALSAEQMETLYESYPTPPTPENLTPHVYVGPDQSTVLPKSSIKLTGYADDTDGTVTNYAWTKVSGPNTPTFSSPSASSTTVSNLVAGTYVFQLEVTDDDGATSTDSVQTTVVASSTQAGGVTHTYGDGETGEALYIEYQDDINCGDTIAIQAGTYRGINIDGVTGCAGNPVIVTNTGGQVVLTDWGINLYDDHYVTVKPETPGTYGFKITGPASGVSVQEDSNDLDISGTWSYGTTTDGTHSGAHYGFVVKTDPSCDTINYIYPSLIKNINIHDNLIEGTLYEGMYLGYYDPDVMDLSCNNVQIGVKAERISNVNVHDNILHNTGNDAIKLRLCNDGCDVYDNTISGYGVLRTSDASWCFGITIGSETYGKIYGNVIDHGYCSAIDVRTNNSPNVSSPNPHYENIPYEIYDNTTSYAGTLPNGSTAALWASGIDYTVLSTDQSFKIYNNKSSHQNGSDVSIADNGSYPFSGSICNSGAYIIWQKTMGPAYCNNDTFVSVSANNKQVITTSTTTIYGQAQASASSTINGYQWYQESGPNTATTDMASSSADWGISSNLSNLQTGTYVFRLHSTDTSGAQGDAWTTVNVNNGAYADFDDSGSHSNGNNQGTLTGSSSVNQIPFASAGTDQTLSTGATSTTLDGSASTDSDGSLTNYSWSEVSGPNIINTGLVANWSLDSSTLNWTNNTAADISGNNHTGNLYNLSSSTSPTTGEKGEALNLVRSNSQYIQLPHDSDFDLTTYTLSTWVKFNSTNSNQFLMTKVNDNNTVNNFFLAYYTTNSYCHNVDNPNPTGKVISVGFTYGSSGDFSSACAGFTPTVGQWYLITETYDQSHLNIYINGVLSDSESWTGVPNASSSQPLTIGWSGVTGFFAGDYLDGSMDDVRIYNQALSASEVSNLYKSGPTLISPNSATTSVSGLTTGNYTFKLTVTDDDNATSSDEVNVTIPAGANTLPTAAAGTDQNLSSGITSTTLDGSASTDGDGSIVSYAWSKVSGSGTIVSPSLISTPVTGLIAGTSTFKLTVTDNQGATSSDTVNITVNSGYAWTQTFNDDFNRSASTTVGNGWLDGAPGNTISSSSILNLSYRGSPTNPWKDTLLRPASETYQDQRIVIDSPAGNTQSNSTSLFGVLRYQDETDMYVAGIFANTLWIAKIDNNIATDLGPKINITFNSNHSYRLDFSATGTSPTTLTAILTDTTTGVVVANASYTDSEADLQNTGQVGLYAYTSSSLNPAWKVSQVTTYANASNFSPASSYTLTGPTTTTVNIASGNFTVTPDGIYTGVITPSDGGAGGTFSPSSLTFASSSLAQTFTYTPASVGTKTISITSNPAITNPTSLVVSVMNPDAGQFSINNSKIFYSPYTWRFDSSNWAQTSPAGGYLKLAFSGDTLGLRVDTSVLGSISPSDIKVHAYIDGATSPIVKTLADVTDNKLIFTNSLSTGNHYAIIYLSTTPFSVDRWIGPDDALRITGIQLASNGTLQDLSATPIAPTAQKILFLGDSITEGYKTSGAEYSYAAVAAKNLGLEYGQVAYSGIGWDVAGPNNVPPLYDSTTPQDSFWRNYDSHESRMTDNTDLSKGFANGTPSAVYINMASNDALQNKTASDIETKAPLLLSDLRTALGAWPAIFVIVPSELYASGKSAYRTYLLAGVNDYLNAHPSDQRVYIIDWGTAGYQEVVNNSSDGLHPDDSGSATLGGWLVASTSPYIITPVTTISNISVTIASTSASVTWTTDADSSSLVNYGLTSSYSSSTVEIDNATNTRTTSHTVIIPDLNTCTTYHYSVRSRDLALDTVSSNDANFTTDCPSNLPPLSSAGSDQSITLPTNSITLDGTGSSDSDGSIVSYTWSRVSGVGNITSPNTSTTSVTDLQQGLSTFELVVTDNQGATSSDTVVITVNPQATSGGGGGGNGGGVISSGGGGGGAPYIPPTTSCSNGTLVNGVCTTYTNSSTTNTTPDQNDNQTGNQDNTGGESYSYVTVTTGTLNVRASATTNSNVLSQVHLGEQIQVLENHGDWYKIQTSNGLTGYVSSLYTSNITQTNNNSSSNSSNTSAYAMITTTTLNVRQFPTTASNVVTQVHQGETVEVIDTLPGWLKIKTDDGQVNYISSDYAQVTNTTNNNSSGGSNSGSSQSSPSTSITTPTLNVRTSPTTSSKVITQVHQGETVTVLQDLNDWLQVKASDGTIGYIYSLYTSGVQGTSNTPTNTPTNTNSSNNNNPNTTNQSNNNNSENSTPSNPNQSNPSSPTTQTVSNGGVTITFTYGDGSQNTVVPTMTTPTLPTVDTSNNNQNNNSTPNTVITPTYTPPAVNSNTTNYIPKNTIASLRITSNNVNVYSSNSLSSSIVTTLQTGDKVSIVEVLSGWFHIWTSTGLEGYLKN